MTPARRTALALLWLAALLVAGWLVGQRLELSGDLRRFMPEPRTPAQKLLVDELGDGPGSRLLLLSLKNLLLCVLTLGLYWPHAVVATTRLRLESITLSRLPGTN